MRNEFPPNCDRYRWWPTYLLHIRRRWRPAAERGSTSTTTLFQSEATGCASSIFEVSVVRTACVRINTTFGLLCAFI